MADNYVPIVFNIKTETDNQILEYLGSVSANELRNVKVIKYKKLPYWAISLQIAVEDLEKIFNTELVDTGQKDGNELTIFNPKRALTIPKALEDLVLSSVTHNYLVQMF